MNEGFSHFLTVTMAFFAIMNPIANTPIFLGLTDGFSAEDRRWVAFRGVLIAFGIIAVFTLAGNEIFKMFGITLPAFRITGGVLIALVGFKMLQGEGSSVHTPTSEDNENSRDAKLNIAITPLALPLLAGPGTIATAMSFTTGDDHENIGLVLGALALICSVTFVTFCVGEKLTDFLGQNAIKVVTRLMGLLLAVIGVQMLITGIQGVDWA